MDLPSTIFYGAKRFGRLEEVVDPESQYNECCALDIIPPDL